jgi:hypothetical protein
VEANITINEVEEEDSRACVDGGLTKSDEEDKSTIPKTQSLEENMTNEEEEGSKLATPRTKIGSNDVNNTPKEVGSI